MAMNELLFTRLYVLMMISSNLLTVYMQNFVCAIFSSLILFVAFGNGSMSSDGKDLFPHKLQLETDRLRVNDSDS